jgi:hypothetical protein
VWIRYRSEVVQESRTCELGRGRRVVGEWRDGELSAAPETDGFRGA